MPPVVFSQPLNTLKSTKKKIKVALFFPFSGKSKDLGFSLYNAAVMSLFDNDLNHNIELVLVDSKDTAIDAKKAFKEEIINKDIKIVIGPVFGNLTEEIAKDAMNNAITAISFSNNQDLRGKINNKGGIFVAGFLPEQQIDKIVSYAIDQDKINFAILAPNNNYGTTIAAIMKKTVQNRDGKIITTEFYEPSGNQVEKNVERVVKAFSAPKHLAEGGGNKVNKNHIFRDSDRAYPQVILIAESGKLLSKITAAIKDYNVEERDYQLVGTAQWDDISSLNDPNLQGAWFAAPIHERFAKFEKSYYQSYNKFPPRIASISYDLVSVIAELTDKNGEQTPNIQNFVLYNNTPKDNIASKNGFLGIDGNFRFLSNGLVQRNMSILEISGNDFKVIDQPSEKFLKF